MVTRRLSNVGQSCRKKEFTPLNNVYGATIMIQALTPWLGVPGKEVAVLVMKEATGQ